MNSPSPLDEAFGNAPRRGGAPLSASIGPVLISGGLMVLFVFGAVFFWFFCRIEPEPGEFAVLIRKTGDDLAEGQVLATAPGEKGIHLEVLSEGRHFRSPYTWAWEIHKVTDIPAGQLGVQTRLHGKPLAEGRIMAEPGSKGIVPEVLRPGKYRINPYAYKVELFDATQIAAGSAGVVTSLVGDDLFTRPEVRENAFLAPAGFKGVQPAILDPGTYYLNPYAVTVAEVNLQSQRFEMSGDDAINFLTVDGFIVHVEGTIEYALIPQKVAEVTHRVGDMEDIIKKIVMPLARGFSRLEGSKNPAKNYITGQTRQQFQDNLEAHLKARCLGWGVAVHSVLIRNIAPPDEIASIIREREIAVQNAHKIEQQITQARSQAELARQEMLAQQNKEKVEAETARLRALITARQNQEVRLIAARQQLEVVKLEAAAAEAQADALLLKAEADRKVIELTNEAQSGVMAGKVQAFGGGLPFARHALYEKLGPRIDSILAGDDDNGLGGLFRPFLPNAPRP